MFTTRPELQGTFGMVASTHWLASAAGMGILERGGNAFDAAVAAGFVLQVVEPHLNGPGGEVPILLYSAERDEVLVVAGQGPAPAAATIDRFRALELELVPGTGLLAACVPGAFDAWMLLLSEFGTLTLAEVLEPALGYAERGYPLVPGISATIASVEELFRAEWPESARLYLRGNAVPAPGSLFHNAELAATYRQIAAEAVRAGHDRERQIKAARDAFYGGFVAEAIAAYLERAEAMDSSGRRHRGLLTGDDLASWRATIERPVGFGYRGVTVYKTGPWGQGPVFLQQLALLEGFDLGTMGRDSAELVHTVVECAKLAFADREAWYGDPDFAEVPLAGLLDAGYAGRRRALVGAEASLELRPGSVGGRAPRLPPAPPRREPGAAGMGGPTVAAGPPGARDTCHVAAADRFGNMVACTPSGGWLQSSPTIPELGFCLGTRGQMFWLAEGLPNSLAGGKRPRTTLSPSLALRDGEPWLAFGTPGGDNQDQWSLAWFLWLLHYGLDLQQATDAPGFHSEHFPSSFHPRRARPGVLAVEERTGPATVARLRARGHRVEVVDGWSLGRVCAVGRDPRSGFLLAAASPRSRQGYAAGR
jgi:gamma-glutamyltranspeptidase/glutathione hydrolase